MRADPVRQFLLFQLLLLGGHCVLARAEVVLQPVSVTASANADEDVAASSRVVLDGKQLPETGASTLSELTRFMPGLTAFGSTPRVTGFNIRGLGNNQFNDGLDSSVGLYVDGFYLARQSYGAFGLFDIEQVSLLRGPQGAAYGMDSSAGEVQLKTREPAMLPQADLSLSAGNFGYQQLSTALNMPLAEDRLAARLSLYSQRRDGLLHNRFDGSDYNDQDRLGVRAQLLWLPSDAWRVRFAAEHGELDQRCCVSPLLAPVRAGLQAADAYMGYERVGTDPYSREVDNDVAPLGQVRQQSLSASVDWTPSGRDRLVSLSSVRELSYDPARNDDGTSMHLLTGMVTSRSRQLTQEFRWHHEYTRARTVLGAFYMRQDVSGNEVGVLGDEMALWAFGGMLRERVPGLTRRNSGAALSLLIPPRTLDGLTVATPYVQVSDTLSAFMSADWLLTDATTLTTGLRWTGSRREADISRRRYGGDLSASPLALTNVLAPLGSLLGLDLSDVTFNGFIDSLVGEPFQRQESRSDQGVSGRIALLHRLSDHVSVHAALSQGYKSGGINLTGVSSRVAPQFDPELTRAAEVGLEGLWLDDHLRLALSVYHTDVRDYQAVTYDEGDGLIPNPRQNNVLNIPSVRLQGAELDLGLSLRQGFSLALGVAYNRAVSREFDSAPNEDTRANDKDLSGRQLHNAPLWSAHAGIMQRIALPGSRELYVALDHAFRSGTYAAVEQSRNSYIDAYQITDVRLGLRDSREHWGVQAWVRNVFDTQYLSAVAGIYGVGDYGAYAGDPRTYGVTVEAAWGR